MAQILLPTMKEEVSRQRGAVTPAPTVGEEAGDTEKKKFRRRRGGKDTFLTGDLVPEGVPPGRFLG